MDEKTRQLVLETLTGAHVAALKAIQATLDGLPAPEQTVAHRSIDDVHECMQHVLDGSLSPEKAQERITGLIHGHPSPRVVRLLKDYAENVNYLLVDSRNGLMSTAKPTEH